VRCARRYGSRARSTGTTAACRCSSEVGDGGAGVRQPSDAGLQKATALGPANWAYYWHSHPTCRRLDMPIFRTPLDRCNNPMICKNRYLCTFICSNTRNTGTKVCKPTQHQRRPRPGCQYSSILKRPPRQEETTPVGYLTQASPRSFVTTHSRRLLCITTKVTNKPTTERPKEGCTLQTWSSAEVPHHIAATWRQSADACSDDLGKLQGLTESGEASDWLLMWNLSGDEANEDRQGSEHDSSVLDKSARWRSTITFAHISADSC